MCEKKKWEKQENAGCKAMSNKKINWQHANTCGWNAVGICIAVTFFLHNFYSIFISHFIKTFFLYKCIN